MEVHGKLLMKGLVQRGHEVTVISTRHPEGKEFEEWNGIRLYYLKDTTFGALRKGWRIECLKKFIELNGNFDIICCQQPIIPYRLLKRVWKKTSVVVIMEGHEGLMFLSTFRQMLSHRKSFLQLYKNFGSFLYHYLFWELPVLHRVDAIIAVSDEIARSIRRWYFVAPKKIYTVYNGIETEIFRPDAGQREEIRKLYGISSDEKLLLFSSHVTKQKGLHIAIKALSLIAGKREKMKLMVVGGGEYLEDAKKLAKELGLGRNIIFTGYISREDIPRYINAADIFIFPTIRQEGLPFALIEAMACEKPVIASRIGGVPSVISDGEDGLMVSPGDVKDLAEKTLYLLSNPHIAGKLASRARKKVEDKFSVNKMVDDTIGIFRKVSEPTYG